MGIYVGKSNNDTNICMSDNIVGRSLFVGFKKQWPLYEFSFFDGVVQKSFEDIESKGLPKQVPIRTCEDSFEHRLEFDIEYYTKLNSDIHLYDATAYCYSKQTTNYWLREANTTVLIGSNNQHVIFDDTYTEINTDDKCKSNTEDHTLTINIARNDWFTQRSGYLQCVQFDEWQHKSHTTDNNFIHNDNPSDNLPTIYFTQKSNTWGKNEQNIDISVSNPNAQEGCYANDEIITVTWQIYSMSESGANIYYGSNIASNGEDKEKYDVGKMWLTTSNNNLEFIDGSIKHTYEVSNNNELICTWEAQYKWTADSTQCTKTIEWSGLPNGEVSADENSQHNITAVCKHVYPAEQNVFTVHVNNFGNWRKGSNSSLVSKCEASDDKECKISENASDIDNPNYTTTNYLLTFNKVSSEDKYTLLCNKSEVGTNADNFIVTSFYKTIYGNGAVKTLYAWCDQNYVENTIVKQEDLEAITFYDSNFTVECHETNSVEITPSTIPSTTTNNNEVSFTIDLHDPLHDTGVDGTITIKQYIHDVEKTEANLVNTCTLIHQARPKPISNYTYKIIITDSANGLTSINYFTLQGETTTQTVYCRVFETCITKRAGEIDNDLSYYDRPLRWVNTYNDETTVKTLNDVNFKFNYYNDKDTWSGIAETKDNASNQNNSYIKLTINGTVNDEYTDVETLNSSICKLEKFEDTYTKIEKYSTNEDAFKFTIKATSPMLPGVIIRRGLFSAELNIANVGAYSNWEQTYSSEPNITADTKWEPLSSIDQSEFEVNIGTADDKTKYDNWFAVKEIVSIGNGLYDVRIKLIKDYYAETSLGNLHKDVNITMNAIEPNKYSIDVNSEQTEYTYKVKVIGTKQYYTRNNGTEQERNVIATISCSRVNENKQHDVVITTSKNQQVRVTDIDSIELTDKTITWSIVNDSMTETDRTALFSNKLIDDKYTNDAYTSHIVINQRVSGSNVSKTVQFKAYLEDTKQSQIFETTWTPGPPKPFTVTIQYTLTNYKPNTSPTISLTSTVKEGNNNVEDLIVFDGNKSLIDLTSNANEAILAEADVPQSYSVQVVKTFETWEDITVTGYIYDQTTGSIIKTNNTGLLTWDSRPENTTIFLNHIWDHYEIILEHDNIVTCPNTPIVVRYKLKHNNEVINETADISNGTLFTTQQQQINTDNNVITFKPTTKNKCRTTTRTETYTLSKGDAQETVTIVLSDYWDINFDTNDYGTTTDNYYIEDINEDKTNTFTVETSSTKGYTVNNVTVTDGTNNVTYTNTLTSVTIPNNAFVLDTSDVSKTITITLNITPNDNKYCPNCSTLSCTKQIIIRHKPTYSAKCSTDTSCVQGTVYITWQFMKDNEYISYNDPSICSATITCTEYSISNYFDVSTSFNATTGINTVSIEVKSYYYSTIGGENVTFNVKFNDKDNDNLPNSTENFSIYYNDYYEIVDKTSSNDSINTIYTGYNDYVTYSYFGLKQNGTYLTSVPKGLTISYYSYSPSISDLKCIYNNGNSDKLITLTSNLNKNSTATDVDIYLSITDGGCNKDITDYAHYTVGKTVTDYECYGIVIS